MITVGAFVIVAGLGAVIRWQAARVADHIVDAPVGLLIVNVLGSVGLGVLVARDAAWLAVVGTGFLGALTSVSGLATALSDWLSRGHRSRSAGYVALSLLLGVGGAWVGLQL